MPNLRLPRKSALHWVLVLPFVLQITVAVGLTGYFSIRNGQRAVSDLTGQLRREVSGRVEQRLDTLLALPHQLSQQTLDGIDSGAIALQAFRANGRYFARQVQANSDISFWGYYLETQQGVGAGRWMSGQDVTIAELVQPGGPEHTYAIDEQGNPTQVLKSYSKYDPRQEVWYQEIVRSRRPIWTDVFVSSDVEGYISASAGAPIYNRQGKLLGVVTADILLTRISDFLRNLSISPQGKVFIIERNGLLIGQSSPGNTIQIQQGKNRRLSIFESTDPKIRATAQFLQQSFGDLRQIQTPQALEFSGEHTTLWKSDRQFVQVTPWRDAYGLDWLVIVTMPESDFTAQIHANTRNTLLLCALSFVAALLSGWYTSRWIARPIAALSHASQSIATGKLDQRVPARSSIQEVDRLAVSFNQMAHRLQTAFGQAQQALEESEDRFTKVFRCSPDAIAIVALGSDRLIEVNESFCRLTGYERVEVIGRTTAEIGLWAEIGDRDQLTQALKQPEAIANLEFSLRHRSGQIKTILLSAERMNLEGRECVLEISRDISDRKQTEVETLNALSRERELNELKTRFVSTVSHEFRTPLTTIQSSAELLEYYDWTEAARKERFEQIKGAIKHMIQLLDETLLIGKLESGGLSPNRFLLDLESLCREAIADISLTYSRHKILHQTIGTPYPVQLDPILLRQILNNLLSNAVKYSPQHSEIHLTLTYKPQQFTLTVQDFGIGIPSTELENLFQPFYRATNADSIQGTGLGLSIVKRCAELQQGIVEVHSQLGAGTAFTVTFERAGGVIGGQEGE